ncbi:unnamed protein product [Rotaria sp. Silwood1]|nr:unnamed protein product [Rotaria sp. Silwood1]CAF1588731.1 unnamed protein product [Rotaria sp. Silwood1]CAF3645750.1 unnamed protein product [Rotaria sp. Silwood1]CAF3698449.1 unnamed protein product [Rotaria sp. Silwood1]CAF4757966.1 unnamed protein product [Rotaria sp. Silwood1]
MDLAAIEIRALVKQAHEHYIMSYASKIGRALIRPIKRKETMDTYMPSSNPEESSLFQPAIKRKLIEDKEDQQEQQQLITNGQLIVVSDHNDDAMMPDETREPRLDHVEIFVNHICERMQTRISKDQNAKIHEDSS